MPCPFVPSRSVLTILGDKPLARGPDGRLKTRIGTIFPGSGVLVTISPGPHAMQRWAYLDELNRTLGESGMPLLTRVQENAIWNSAVDLVMMEDDTVLIRPDPERMQLAFWADEMLQDLVPKRQIRFLHVLNKKVRTAIKKRGECWRIHPLPRSSDEMESMIATSRIGIGGDEIYYYNNTSGTRFLTYQSFAGLEELDDDELRAYLLEIREFSNRYNAQAKPEIDFFMAEGAFSRGNFSAYELAAMDEACLRTAYWELKRDFAAAVPPEYHRDDYENAAWRNQMFAALIAQDDEVVTEEMLLGLSPEFFMRIQWLPGGRIEDGELLYDSIFDTADAEGQKLHDDNARGFIANLAREHGELEYVNVGRVVESLALRPASGGRRGVYIVEFKDRNRDRETVSIIRLQKWDVHKHLDDGLSLAEAVGRSDSYTEYLLDRWRACCELGMNLPGRVTAGKIPERYAGTRQELLGAEISTPYFKRDYIHGIATDKIPLHRLEDADFTAAFARLLGAAAATNMIVGRCSRDGDVIFDDGDEVLTEDETGMPVKIVVADQTGNFVEYKKELASTAPAYAGPINRRAVHLADVEQFAGVYLEAFLRQFERTQHKYRENRGLLDSLFQHRTYDENGSIACRWHKVLQRLDRSDPHELARIIRRHVNV